MEQTTFKRKELVERIYELLDPFFPLLGKTSINRLHQDQVHNLGFFLLRDDSPAHHGNGIRRPNTPRYGINKQGIFFSGTGGRLRRYRTGMKDYIGQWGLDLGTPATLSVPFLEALANYLGSKNGTESYG